MLPTADRVLLTQAELDQVVAELEALRVNYRDEWTSSSSCGSSAWWRWRP